MKRLVSILIMSSMIYGIAGALERTTPNPSDPANAVRADNNFARIDEQYETIEAAILALYTAEVTIPASTASKTVTLSGVKPSSTFVAIPKTDMAGTITFSITIPAQTVSKPSQAILVPQQYVIKPSQTITFPTLQINITDSAGDTAAVIIPEQTLTSALQYIDVPAQYITSDAQNVTVPAQAVNLPTENAYSKIINVACSTDSITLTRDITLHTAEITVSLVGFK